MFEVSFRGQFGKFIGRELTAQKTPELLAEPKPGCSQGHIVALRAPPIDQLQSACKFSKPRDAEHQLARRFALNCVDRSHQIAPLIPGLQLGARAACFHHKIFGCNGQPFLTRLAQHGILAGFEEALDRLEDFSHLGPYRPRSGRTLGLEFRIRAVPPVDPD